MARTFTAQFTTECVTGDCKMTPTEQRQRNLAAFLGLATEGPMTEHDARTMMFHAANYLHANQLGDPSRVKAMDMLDDIRRDWANWRDLSTFYGMEYRSYPVFRS